MVCNGRRAVTATRIADQRAADGAPSRACMAARTQDHSFTCTLFMPFGNFDSVKTHDDVLKLFEAEFPDALKLMGREALLRDYFANPTGALMTVKVRPARASVRSGAVHRVLTHRRCCVFPAQVRGVSCSAHRTTLAAAS